MFGHVLSPSLSPALFFLHSSAGIKGGSRIQSNHGFARRSSSITRVPLSVSIAASSSSSSSSSFVGGSGAEYSEPVYDSKAKQRRKIAGIDQEELLEPISLADPDSCFCKFNDLEVHYKVYDPELQGDSLCQTRTPTPTPDPPALPLTSIPHRTNKIGLPMILLHGFGASVFSWNWVMKPLADITGSKVLAFDRPAFGLTSRVDYLGNSSAGTKDKKPLNPYSMAFSVLATLYFIGFLGAEKAILIGHSAGSLVAVNSYFQDPQSVAALILVAPSILAPLGGGRLPRDNPVQENVSDSNVVGNPIIHLFKILSTVAKYIVQSIMQMMKRILGIVDFFYIKLLSAFLRSTLILTLVRIIIDKAGIVAIKNAWYDSARVNEHVLHGYTKPLRTKNWDKALVEFVAAMLTDRTSPPLSKRLHEISCPVLIITGDSDRLVPSWNAVKLSQAIPGSHLEVIKQCGHLPHEEKVDEFVSIVQKFLYRAFVDSQEQ
ncbi:2-hydroxy-6-oxo-6-phenylhexa-2,4-dienoate hydrolase [Benincasa hispida]|uniref:2-hydroxy-6-oxo-6-phenylhexa-2,4-dienoate hydrolase n=1 Tax=Benincasa hispida TaxID=102211 RepID=UPI001900B1C5|nr:2-hydroxy-6-oxo-6-phenylhexa-2,4-dienoate hydrolase [Benincasa hispida]